MYESIIQWELEWFVNLQYIITKSLNVLTSKMFVDKGIALLSLLMKGLTERAPLSTE